MDKIKTLSAAIRYGSTFIGESKQFVWRDTRTGPFTCGCAIGTAFLAVVEPGCSCISSATRIINPLFERFRVPIDVIENVSCMHWRGEKTRAQCADWLEQQGY